MAGVEHAPTDNATLLRRIVQLEHERDELRCSVAQLSTSHTGSFASVDIAGIQRRRATSLEQELEACQRKVTACSKENTKLQEELSEVYVIKSKFAELLKVEVEKSAGLEKEVKFYQSRAAAALSDRDRCIVEIEKYQRKEDGMVETMTELQDRLEQLTSEYTQEKNLSSELQKDLEKTKAESEVYQKVVERFWKVRQQGTGFCDAEKIQERARILIQDSEDFWSYGEMNQNLQAQVKQAKADLESAGRRQAEDAVFRYKEQLSCLMELVNSELQQIQSTKVSLKEDIVFFLQEEGDWLLSISESWQHALGKDGTYSTVSKPIVIDDADEKVDTTSGPTGKAPGGTSEQFKSFCAEEMIQNVNRPVEEDSQMHLLEDIKEGFDQVSHEMNGENRTFEVDDHPMRVADNTQEASTQDLERKDKQAGDRTLDVDSQMLLSDDSREAFAQALHEKVAALLLLSQQEERHILEENTTSALESQIADLKQQLLQVTSEKVHALMELSQLHHECKKLRKEEKNFKQTIYKRLFSSNGLTPVDNHGDMSDDENNVVHLASDSVRKASLQGYLKNLWLRGPELSFRSKSLSHLLSLSTSKENETAGIARLRVENASLRENISSIRHLCTSSNRLRLTIARVAVESDAQTENFIQAAVEAMDGVISEALHLKVALRSSVPENDLGWNSIGSPLARASETSQEGSDGEANDDLDVVSFLGQEIVRLVLLAAQLQKRLLALNVPKQ